MYVCICTYVCIYMCNTCTGDVVTDYYDSMISKLIVWDKDRQSALRKLQNCLARYQVPVINTCKYVFTCVFCRLQV